MSRAAHRKASMVDDDLLPTPPTDLEKYSYMRRQHRWFAFFALLGCCLAIGSVVRLSLSSHAALFLLPWAVMMAASAGVSLWSSGRGHRYRLSQHRQFIDERIAPNVLPSVDVFLPSCGESLAVLENTYASVRELEWDGALNVYVLDDSARPEVERMAETFGFQYLTRPNRGYLKKAGNLAYGYGHSDGDLILVLDADFAPRRDMLAEMVPYFDDESIGILQTPQFFDATSAMNWVQRTSGAAQHLFYRFIQPSRDKVDGAICVGTNAIYRRSALESSDGFAQIGHSEDVHTGVNMIRAGYKVRYLPLVLAKGLCPDTLSGHVNMMYRWCTGSLSLMADRKFHATPMRPTQRACYWTGFIYYITTAVGVVVGLLPALMVIWFFPQFVHPANIWPLIPSLVCGLVVLPALLGTARVMDVLRLNLVNSYTFLHALVDFTRRRSAAWVPTGVASSTPLDRKVRRTIIVWGGLVHLALCTGIARGIVNHGLEQYSAMAALTGLSLWIYLSVVLPSRQIPAAASAGAFILRQTQRVVAERVSA